MRESSPFWARLLPTALVVNVATLGPLAATGGGTTPAGGTISVADATDLAVTAPVSATYDIALSTSGEPAS